MMYDKDQPAATRCPVAGCEYGDRETRTLDAVATHVQSVDDVAHDREQRRRDWNYEHSLVE